MVLVELKHGMIPLSSSDATLVFYTARIACFILK